jgi:hypothetical protein
MELRAMIQYPSEWHMEKAGFLEVPYRNTPNILPIIFAIISRIT